MAAPVVDQSRAVTKAARYRLGGPGEKCRLADILDADDLQFRVPETGLLGVENRPMIRSSAGA